MSALIGVHHSRHRSRQRFRHAAERHAEGIGDLPIAEALRPQRQAPPVPFGQRAEHGQQTLPAFEDRQLLFGVRPVVGSGRPGRVRNLRRLQGLPPLRPQALLERQVVRDPEQPAPEVRSGPAKLDVSEQRQEHVLHDVFCIVDVDAEGAHIPDERRAALVEERQDLGFDVGFGILLDARLDVEDRREDESRIGLRHRVAGFYTGPVAKECVNKRARPGIHGWRYPVTMKCLPALVIVLAGLRVRRLGAPGDHTAARLRPHLRRRPPWGSTSRTRHRATSRSSTRPRRPSSGRCRSESGREGSPPARTANFYTSRSADRRRPLPGWTRRRCLRPTAAPTASASSTSPRASWSAC